MTYMIYPYNSASEGAKSLRDGLEAKLIRTSSSTYKKKAGDVIINWGSSNNPFKDALNADISGIISKKAFFDRLAYSGLVPKFATTSQGAAALGTDIVCRKEDQGKDGSGIVLVKKGDSIPQAKLYVELKEKTAEYRVHVGRDKAGKVTVLGHQKKVWKGEGPIWVGDNCSLVWTVNGVPAVLPATVAEVAVKTMELFPEITFAGLDIGYNSNDKTAYVFEANSAPQMTPKTVELYAKFFQSNFPTEVEVAVAAPAPTSINAQAYDVNNLKAGALKATNRAELIEWFIMSSGTTNFFEKFKKELLDA